MAQGSKIVEKVLSHRGGKSSSLVGIAATIALIVGYFMPVISLSSILEKSLGVDAGVAARSASRSGDERAKKIAERLGRGEAISTRDWASVLDAVEDEGGLEPQQQRAVSAARIGVVALPWAAGGLAVLLLALGVRSRHAMRAGLAPLAAVLAIAQTRVVSTLLLVLMMMLSLIVFGIVALLWSSVKFLGETESTTGNGLLLMAGGSGVAFLSAFFGYGPGRLRAVIWALFLIIVLGLVIFLRVKAA